MPAPNSICASSVEVCRLRMTRLTATGAVDTGTKSSIVTDRITHLNYTVEVDAGNDITTVSGCDCIVVTKRGRDKFKRFTFELEGTAFDWALIEMATGMSSILNTATTPQPIGVNWPVAQAGCVGSPAMVGMEAWTLAWLGDHQDSGYPYIRFVWTSTIWRIGDGVLQNDVLLPQLTGYSQGNAAWGAHGPYAADATGPAIDVSGGVYLDTAMPALTVGCPTYATAA
jgi:hypothetical protein